MADDATSVADDGTFLPQQILAGARLIFPANLGLYAYLSAAAVTQNMITLLFSASDDLAATNVSPLCSVSVLRQNFQFGRQYPVSPQNNGVGGWVAIGNAFGDTCSLRFSSPAQSKLVRRAYRPYGPLPVRSFGAMGQATGLQGVVNLQADKPLEIIGADRLIGLVERRVAVIRLTSEDPSKSADGSPTVFEQFIGSCDRRPESGNCKDREAIEFVSTVPPDCDGAITVVFAGCAKIAEVNGQCAVTIDCGLGLSGACPTPRLPSEEGYLPSSFQDNCSDSDDPVVGGTLPLSAPGGPNLEDVYIGLEYVAPPSGGGGESPAFVPPSTITGERTEVTGTLPWSADFSTGDPFLVVRGGFDIIDVGGSDVYSSTNNQNRYNVAIWYSFNLLTTSREVIANFVIDGAPANADPSAGIVLNYRDSVGVVTYFELVADYLSQELRIERVNNGARAVVASAPVSGLVPGSEYRLTATSLEVSETNASITGQIESVADASVNVTLGPYVTNRYYPDDGSFGVSVNRGNVYFKGFTVGVASA